MLLVQVSFQLGWSKVIPQTRYLRWNNALFGAFENVAHEFTRILLSSFVGFSRCHLIIVFLPISESFFSFCLSRFICALGVVRVDIRIVSEPSVRKLMHIYDSIIVIMEGKRIGWRDCMVETEIAPVV